jgi:hypothetical protein
MTWNIRKSFLQNIKQPYFLWEYIRGQNYCWHLSYVITSVNEIDQWELRRFFGRKHIWHSHLKIQTYKELIILTLVFLEFQKSKPWRAELTWIMLTLFTRHYRSVYMTNLPVYPENNIVPNLRKHKNWTRQELKYAV